MLWHGQLQNICLFIGRLVKSFPITHTKLPGHTLQGMCSPSDFYFLESIDLGHIGTLTRYFQFLKTTGYFPIVAQLPSVAATCFWGKVHLIYRVADRYERQIDVVVKV